MKVIPCALSPSLSTLLANPDPFASTRRRPPPSPAASSLAASPPSHVLCRSPAPRYASIARRLLTVARSCPTAARSPGREPATRSDKPPSPGAAPPSPGAHVSSRLIWRNIEVIAEGLVKILWIQLI